MHKLALSVAALAFAASGNATPHLTEAGGTHKGPLGFPEFDQPKIKGAPTLSRPFMVMGDKMPVRTQKHGLVSPAVFDWNGDGKRDLLVGEFETCTKSSTPSFPWGEKGSAIRVYLNEGTDANPQFSDTFSYARDVNGTILEVEQW